MNKNLEYKQRRVTYVTKGAVIPFLDKLVEERPCFVRIQLFKILVALEVEQGIIVMQRLSEEEWGVVMLTRRRHTTHAKLAVPLCAASD